MFKAILSIICCALIAACSVAAGSGRVAVSKDEAQAWVRCTIPLPKSIEIPAKTIVAKRDIVIVTPAGSDPVIAQACKELREVIGLTQQPGAASGAFKITMQLGGPEADKLTSVKNSDQAYRIVPEPGDSGLRLVALKPVGLYYAAKTLQQLVKPKVSETSVVIPLLTVTDWPDMDDRGLWGGDAYEVLRWLGDRKMNICEQTSERSVSSDGKGHASLRPGCEPMADEGPLYGVKCVPLIPHLELTAYTGIFEAYPNLKAKGGQDGCICYSHPQIVDVLADWIAGLGSVRNSSGVDVWMAENLHGKGGCQCEECRKTDRSVLESRVIISAWRKAQERLGRKIPLYVLSSEETYSANPVILKELPAEVRFWYYYWLTYNTSRSPMIPDYIAEWAKRRWVGIVPSLDSMTCFTEPFHGADFIHYRMNEFVDKGLQGLLGYATPRVLYFSFNVEAAAEWSWNINGRTPREFTLSYAIRQGIKNPEKWAEWAGLVGPVEWNVYGSDWPIGAERGVQEPVAKSLLEGRLPKLGAVLWDAFRMPFGDIKTVKQLDDDVAAAAGALEIAKEMGVPEYWHESLVADGYIKSLKALYELGRLVKDGRVDPQDHEAAGRYFRMYLDGLKQASDALPKWEEVKDTLHERGDYTGKAVKVIDQLRKEMAETAGKLGFEIKP